MPAHPVGRRRNIKTKTRQVSLNSDPNRIAGLGISALCLKMADQWMCR